MPLFQLTPGILARVIKGQMGTNKDTDDSSRSDLTNLLGGIWLGRSETEE